MTSKNVKAITMNGESNIFCNGDVIVKTIAAADEVLRTIAVNKTPGGYSKTFFEIELNDGSKYAGRIDVHYVNGRQETATGRLGVLDHISTQVDFLNGPDCPNYVSADHIQSLNEWFEILDRNHAIDLAK